MVAAQVIGNDACVAFAGSQGNLELNVMMPVMARNVLESARLLANAARLLADKVVAGAEPDVERTREYAESSPSIVTPLNRYLGYEEAASIAKQSLKERRTIREVVLERGHVDDGKLTLEQLDAALDVLAMARAEPGPSGHGLPAAGSRCPPGRPSCRCALRGCGHVAHRGRRHLRRRRGHPVPQGEDRRAGRPAAVGRVRRDRAGHRVAVRRAPAGPDRRRLAHPGRTRRRPGRQRVAVGQRRSTPPWTSWPAPPEPGPPHAGRPCSAASSAPPPQASRSSCAGC